MIRLRNATEPDLPLILDYIKKKSEFDRKIGAFDGSLGVTLTRLREDLFGPLPYAYVVFAENSEESVGFALYNFRYSSFAGLPSLWLDDLFVDADQRSQGAGSALMQHLAEIALERDCTHIAWNADARNARGLNFYFRHGATVTLKDGNRLYFRWEKPFTA